MSFADGGYLDNKPVDLVMQTLPKRRADLHVSRRVLFIDPNPGDDVKIVGMFKASASDDSLGIPVRLDGDTIHYAYPMAICAAVRP